MALNHRATLDALHTYPDSPVPDSTVGAMIAELRESVDTTPEPSAQYPYACTFCGVPTKYSAYCVPCEVRITGTATTAEA